MSRLSSALAVAVTLVLTQFAVAAEDNCADDSRYPEVDKKELTTLVEKKAAFVIDVNGADSFKKSHVPTAIHFEANKDKLATVLPADKATQIVAYCGGPKCTAWKEAARAACKLGYTNIRHFKGGISGWNAKDGKKS